MGEPTVAGCFVLNSTVEPQADQPGAGVDHKTHLDEKDRAAKVMMASYAGTARSAQQNAWVLREQSSVAKQQAWRPKKVHRQAARKFLSAVDNQIAGSTRFRGWVILNLLQGFCGDQSIGGSGHTWGRPLMEAQIVCAELQPGVQVVHQFGEVHGPQSSEA